MNIAPIKKDHVVEKRNVLNEMRATQLSLVELRFLLIYLSKINARDKETRKVRFSLADFVRILEIQKVNISSMRATTHRLLSRIVDIPDYKTGGFTAFQLFKRCRVNKDENDEWFVEIEAHDDALPLMFEFKRDYFKYPLWNALRLNSSQQVRMYEILKQHEHSGGCTFTVGDLKKQLFIDDSAYSRYTIFRRDILDKYQRLLLENTDICYTYEPIRKGQGGKVTAVRFAVSKNDNYIDQLTLEEFICMQGGVEDVDAIAEAFASDDEDGSGPTADEEDPFAFLGGAFADEFNPGQVEELYRTALPYIQRQHPEEGYSGLLIRMYDYFLLKNAQLKAYSKPVKSRYGLLKTFVKADAKDA